MPVTTCLKDHVSLARSEPIRIRLGNPAALLVQLDTPLSQPPAQVALAVRGITGQVVRVFPAPVVALALVERQA